MDASLHRAGGDRRIRPIATAVLVCCTVLILLLCLAGPAAAYRSGRLVWTRTSGAAPHDRGFYAIAKAPNGQFYGVGSVFTGGAKGGDFLVVKYSASGKALWTKTWDAGGGKDLYDYADFAVSDAKGNLWVAGVGVGDSGNDIVTIKYTANGVRKWVKRWNGMITGWHDCRGLAVDADGDCVVAGTVYRGPNNQDIVAIEYDRNGAQKWVGRYNQDDADPTDGPKIATGVAVDGAGDVYVSGGSRADSMNQALVVKFSGLDGAVLKDDVAGAAAGSWAQSIAVRGQAVAISGSTMTVTEQEDCLIVKYDLSLAAQYRFTYADPRGVDARDWADKVAIGAHGNVYAVGISNYPPPGGSGFYNSALVLRVNAAGTAVDWAKTYKPTGKGAEADLLVLDGADTLYVGGYLDTPKSEEDMLLLKYSATGARKWAKTWHGAGVDDDSVGGLVLSGSKTLYVTGEASGKGDLYQSVAQRYDR